MYSDNDEMMIMISTITISNVGEENGDNDEIYKNDDNEDDDTYENNHIDDNNYDNDDNDYDDDKD